MSTGQGTNNAGNRSNNATLTDKLQLFFDAVLTVAACVGIMFGLKQLCFISDQIGVATQANEVAARAAKATETSNEIAAKTANTQLRAYVGVDDATFYAPQEGSTVGMLELKIKNYGQTPAYNVAAYADFAHLDPPFNAEPPGGTRLAMAPSSRVILGPGAILKVEAKTSIWPAEMQLLSSGKRQLQIFGYMGYDDVFKHHWAPTFRMRWRGTAGDKALIFDLRGNDEKD